MNWLDTLFSICVSDMPPAEAIQRVIECGVGSSMFDGIFYSGPAGPSANEVLFIYAEGNDADGVAMTRSTSVDPASESVERMHWLARQPRLGDHVRQVRTPVGWSKSATLTARVGDKAVSDSTVQFLDRAEQSIAWILDRGGAKDTNRRLGRVMASLEAGADFINRLGFTGDDAHTAPGCLAESYPLHGLSGDIVRILPLDDNRVWILLLDAKGHDAESAFVAAMMMQALTRASASVAASPLAAANVVMTELKTLNERVRRQDVHDPTDIDGLFAVLDRSTGSLQFVNHGIQDVFIGRWGGSWEDCGVSSSCGSFGREVESKEVSHVLLKGDVFVAMTDGVRVAAEKETLVAQREFMEGRVLNDLRMALSYGHPTVKVEERIIEVFYQLVTLAQVHGTHRDDMTCVAATRM
jgi:hypothetical protein